MDDSERMADDFGSSPQVIGPFEHVKKVLQQGGFCAPPVSVNSSVVPQAGCTGEAKGVAWVSSAGFDSAIPFHPIENLRKVLHGFCDPIELSKENPATNSEHSVLMARNYDSDDTAKITETVTVLTKEDKVVENQKSSVEEETIVIITEPGTGRLVRVMKALEMFFGAVLVLYFAFSLLRQFGVSIELQPNKSSQSSLIKISF